MVRNKTLLIVGAGASAEFGLPTGVELKSSIARRLDIRFDGFQRISGDSLIHDCLRIEIQGLGERDINPYLHAAWAIRDSMPQALSIDNFIDAHSGDKKIERCGKLAIARCILDAERRSSLFVDPSNVYNSIRFDQVEATWANRFAQVLFESCARHELPERLSSFALVIFNYDRCVEHFLQHALQNYYRVPAEDAAALVDMVEIYHPYGQVGHLRGQPQVAFGAEPSPQMLSAVAGQIRTFAEGTNPDDSEIEAIRKRVRESNIVMFLGFAFHRLNMRLLKSEGDAAASRSCFATAKGISSHDCGLISKEIVNLAPGNYENVFVRSDLTCADLFREYWRALALS